MSTLSEQTKQIVKETAPVLAEHGETITTHFYKRMFEQHPELLNIFNQTNQKQGKQPRALANTVYAAAVHIDNLEAILPAVKQIAHKHRSLNIKPEHYPIVGENLLAAIKEVLHEAPHIDEVVEAWGEAYGVIADVFIQVEKEMYHEAELAPGGWEGFREFTIEKKERESDVITSFYLKPVDGGKIASFKPGQYISIQAHVEGSEYTHMRQYSLSDAPNENYYRISVKKEEGLPDHAPGVVSNDLHDHKNEGDTILITAPAGDFVLNEETDRPVVFISGGVGITPLMSMFNTLIRTESKREISFIHAARSGDYHAMDEHVAGISNAQENVNYAVCYDSPTPTDLKKAHLKKKGHIDEGFLNSMIKNKEADYYFCGPTLFMKEVFKILKGWDVSDDHIHFEFFGPKGNIE